MLDKFWPRYAMPDPKQSSERIYRQRLPSLYAAVHGASPEYQRVLAAGRC